MTSTADRNSKAVKLLLRFGFDSQATLLQNIDKGIAIISEGEHADYQVLGAFPSVCIAASHADLWNKNGESWEEFSVELLPYIDRQPGMVTTYEGYITFDPEPRSQGVSAKSVGAGICDRRVLASLKETVVTICCVPQTTVKGRVKITGPSEQAIRLAEEKVLELYHEGNLKFSDDKNWIDVPVELPK